MGIIDGISSGIKKNKLTTSGILLMLSGIAVLSILNGPIAISLGVALIGFGFALTVLLTNLIFRYAPGNVPGIESNKGLDLEIFRCRENISKKKNEISFEERGSTKERSAKDFLETLLKKGTKIDFFNTQNLELKLTDYSNDKVKEINNDRKQGLYHNILNTKPSQKKDQEALEKFKDNKSELLGKISKYAKEYLKQKPAGRQFLENEDLGLNDKGEKAGKNYFMDYIDDKVKKENTSYITYGVIGSVLGSIGGSIGAIAFRSPIFLAIGIVLGFICTIAAVALNKMQNPEVTKTIGDHETAELSRKNKPIALSTL